MPKRKNRNINTRSGLASFLRRPAVQLAFVAIVAFIVYLIASSGGGTKPALASEVNADDWLSNGSGWSLHAGCAHAGGVG